MEFFKCCFPQNKESIIVNQEFSMNKSQSELKCGDVSKDVSVVDKNLIVDSPSFAKASNPSDQGINKKISFQQNSKIKNTSGKNIDGAENIITLAKSNNQTSMSPNSIEYKIKNEHKLKKKDLDQFDLNSPIKNDNNFNEKFEDTSLFNLFVNYSVSDEAVKIAPILMIEELVGDILKSAKLTINAQGLIGGMRKEKDGLTFFGPQLKTGDTIINDFVLNMEQDNNSPHTFFIYYRTEENKYFIRSYKDKESNNFPIVLIKLEQDYVIKKKQVFKIADYYFQAVIPDEYNIEITKLETKNQEKEKFVFSNTDTPITIGRHKKCRIPYVEDKSFSRIQTTIYFEDNKWIIKDGNDKPSLNGTWLYSQNSYEIKTDTIFRVNSSLIKIQVRYDF